MAKLHCRLRRTNPILRLNYEYRQALLDRVYFRITNNPYEYEDYIYACVYDTLQRTDTKQLKELAK